MDLVTYALYKKLSGGGASDIGDIVIENGILTITKADGTVIEQEISVDWQNILNKPDATDALLVAAETGLIDPIAADEGVFLVDSDGAILIL